MISNTPYLPLQTQRVGKFILNIIGADGTYTNPGILLSERKRREGKHYYVYMTAAANKFLRIYYGTVIAYLEML